MDAASFASEARLATTLPPHRYLGQLCKHFQHKLPVTVDEQFMQGRIEFSVGVCELQADDAQHVLVMQAQAPTLADLERLQDVVARHLVRFAFREEMAVDWTPLGQRAAG